MRQLILSRVVPVLLALGVVAAANGCTRDEPVGTVVTPPSTGALEEIAVYATAVPEPSGLAYRATSHSLFTVSDGNSTVYELDLTGRILHTTVVQNSDLEGIAVTPYGDTLIIADESNKEIALYSTSGTKLSGFTVNVATMPNNALEGVAIDLQNHLYVLNEKLPRLLLEYSGGTEVARTEITAVSDLSDVSYDADADCLWIVSDESQKVLKCTKRGAVTASYGLSFSKGEGVVAVGDRVYVISDATGLLHVFKRPL